MRRDARRPEGSKMTYVVTENCIKCKYMDCVEVCPVDCFYEGENMLVIHPDECIDCGVCEPECPAEAIKPDTEPGLETWLKLNADLAKSWPNITQKKDAPADAKEWDGVPDKFEKFFTAQSRRRRLKRPPRVRRHSPRHQRGPRRIGRLPEFACESRGGFHGRRVNF